MNYRQLALVTIIIAVLFLTLGKGAAMYESTSIERGTMINVASDNNSALQLDSPVESNPKTTEEGTIRENGNFVNITNNFSEQKTVTVTLQNRTQRYDLVYNGQQADSFTFTLSPDETADIDISSNSLTTSDDTVQYRVVAEDTGFTATLVRTQDVRQTLI